MNEPDRVRRGAAVELRAVTRAYGDVVAVDAVDLEIAPGELLSILGPSGCGKSTLLRMVGGLDQPTAGSIAIDGRDVTRLSPERRPTATVFQRGAVFPHLSVRDNVAYPLTVRRVERARRRARVDELLALVRLEALADRLPSALSGGQLQRVAVARALAADPQVLLMDEPLSALDAALKRELQLELRRIHRAVGLTVVFVTHDQEEALVLSDRIAVMDRGRIQQCDVPATLYRAPANAFVARFLGHANVLRATRVAGAAAVGGPLLDWAGHRFAPPDGERDGDGAAGEVAVSVRPTAVRVVPAADPNVARGRVVDAVFLGDVTRLQLDVRGAGVVWAELRAEAGAGYAAGDEVGLAFEPGGVAVVALEATGP